MRTFDKSTMLRLSFKMFLLTVVFFNLVTCQAATKEWEKKKADIFFVADTSASIWIEDYRKQMKFIASLVSDMDIGPSYTRVGIGLYSNKLTVYIPVNNTLTKAQLLAAIPVAPYIPGDGYISRGLEGMRREGLTPSVWRRDVPHASVLFTDDQSRNLQLSKDTAALARKDGIYLFTVSTHRRVGWNELAMISSDPAENYIFEVNDFESFGSIRASLSSRLSQVEYLQEDKGSCGEDVHMDILFVYDEYAYGKYGSKQIKTFLQNVSEDLSINSGHVRVALLSKTCHQGEMNFLQNLKREKFIESLNVDDGPDISSLLKLRKYIFMEEYGARSYAKRILIAFLHGDVSKNVENYREFQRVQFNQIELFIVYTNTDYNKAYVESLNKNKDNIMYVSSPNELLLKKPEFLQMFCRNL